VQRREYEKMADLIKNSTTVKLNYELQRTALEKRTEL
jgi:hypothetical protein